MNLFTICASVRDEYLCLNEIARVFCGKLLKVGKDVSTLSVGKKQQAIIGVVAHLKSFRPLIVAAIALVLTSCAPEPPALDTLTLVERAVVGNVFDTAPVRGAVKPLVHHKAGFVYKCTECHTSIESLRTQHSDIKEHPDVVLTHGINTACVNCHHPTNRNVYVDHDGSEIPSETPARLCAKCHGPTYREWEVGIHGRQNGYWDVTRGLREKLLCIQCHDPHNPAFKPMTPEPSTIRTRFDERRVADAKTDTHAEGGPVHQ